MTEQDISRWMLPVAGLTEKDVFRILTGLGWSPHSVDERTLRCTIPSPVGPLRLVTRYAGAWIYLVILPFFEPNSVQPWGAGKYPKGFLGRLLAVNRNLTLVKFALDDDGDVTLRTELPTESLQRSEFELAINTLVETTKQYRLPVREALLDAASVASEPKDSTFDEG